MNFVNVGGLNLTQIGLGTFPLKGEVLQNAMAVAINNRYGLIDTAFKYKNETDIGEFLTQNVGIFPPVVVQTKFSVTQLTYKKFLWYKYGRNTTKDAIEGSLKRLGKQFLDIYLLHSPSNGYVSLYGDLKEFREQQRVKVIGVCKFDEHQLQDIYDNYGEYPAINQIEVHPFYTNKPLIEFCKEHGILVEARSIFTHGDALTELLNSKLLIDIAERYNKTVPQIILRWIVQQQLVAVVKSETERHIKENAQIFDFELSEIEMAKIDSLNKNQSFGYISTKKKTTN